MSVHQSIWPVNVQFDKASIGWPIEERTVAEFRGWLAKRLAASSGLVVFLTYIMSNVMKTDRVLNRAASFWVAAAVVAHGLWTSAAPAMSYRLYAVEWNLSPTVTTAIFAVYPIVVVGVLILFGDLSDYIGRRATMLLGLGASLIGVVMFAIAPSIAWIFIGRAFMGVGVGLSASAAAAAIVEHSPQGQE